MKNRKPRKSSQDCVGLEDAENLRQYLSLITANALEARVLLGNNDFNFIDLPAGAFDAAIKNSPDYQLARKDVHRLLEQVKQALPSESRLHMKLEDGINHMNVLAAEVGWKMGLLANGNVSK